MAYDFNQPATDTAEIRVVGVGNGGAKAVRRIAEAQVPGARFICLLPRENTAEQGTGPEIFASIFPVDMLLIVVVLDDPTGIRMATTLAGQGRRQGVLTLVIAAQPSSVEQGRALPDLENVLRGFEAAADSVILLDRDRLIDSDRAGDVSPEEACLRLEQAFLMAVRTCVEPITVPGFIGTDYSDVRAILAGGGMSSIGFGYGHGDCAAEEAVEMAMGTSVQRASLIDYTSFLACISAAHTISLHTINRAAAWFQKSVSEDCNIVLASIIDPVFGRGDLMFNFIATGKRRTNAEGRTPT